MRLKNKTRMIVMIMMEDDDDDVETTMRGTREFPGEMRDIQ